jgi:ABC-type Fe3+ transport system permease subunit
MQEFTAQVHVLEDSLIRSTKTSRMKNGKILIFISMPIIMKLLTGLGMIDVMKNLRNLGILLLIGQGYTSIMLDHLNMGEQMQCAIFTQFQQIFI